MKHISRYWAVCLLLAGCAGLDRSCAGCSATNFGADWVIVQMDNNGRPYRCWSLRNASVTNEQSSDGIYWLDTRTGNLVHIAGHYNRVQVEGGRWEHAYAELGLTNATCAAIAATRYDATARDYRAPGAATAPSDAPAEVVGPDPFR